MYKIRSLKKYHRKLSRTLITAPPPKKNGLCQKKKEKINFVLKKREGSGKFHQRIARKVSFWSKHWKKNANFVKASKKKKNIKNAIKT